MVYEGVWFNTKAIVKYNKDAQALAENVSYQHLWPKLNELQRKERLKELFGFCKLLHGCEQ